MACDLLVPDPLLPDDIPPLVAGAVAESFALDYSKPIKVETLQVESLRVDTVQVESLPSVNPQKPTPKPPPVETSAPVQPVVTGGAASEASDNVARQLVEVLQAFNVGVDYLGSVLGPAFVRVKLKPHLGVRVNAILKFEDDIRVHLGLENPPLMSPQAGFISVDLPRPDRQTAFLQDYFKHPEKNTAAVKAAIGIDLDGTLVEADLSDPNTCHFLVGETTGSGKSEFL